MGTKNTIFFTTMGNPNLHVADPAFSMYDWMLHYLGWEDCGRIIANGVSGRGAVKGTKFMQQAYELGKNLK